MKKQLGIYFIILVGIILRLLYINKPDGLWNDEYVSWMISSTPFYQGFWEAVKSQCHMPFYYLYLKFFMAIGGQNDIILRITSVLPGILAIPIMYLVGKEKDEKTGFLSAGFTAISSFLIYYSQEVRFYSVLFLISALCFLYTLRSIKNPSKKNLILCIFFNFMIIFTHTIGFVFVFFNLIFLSFNIFNKSKKFVIWLWSIIITSGLCISPLIFKILTTQSFSQWWGHFSIYKIIFLFTDYFSPVLTNLTNSPDNLFYAPKLVIYLIFPTIIATLGIFKSLKDKINKQLLLICISVILTLTFASVLGKLVFITKYSIEIYPILIYLSCIGILSLQNPKIKKSLITIYCLISLGYIFISPYSAPKIRRAEGHKIMTDILEKMDLKNNDIILLEYYQANRFKKYFDFSKYRVIEIYKGNFPEYMHPEYSYQDVYKNGKKIYQNMFLSPNNYLSSMLEKQIINNLKPGQSVVMVVLNSVCIYNPDQIIQIAKNDEIYNKTPILFMIFSYLKQETFNDLFKTLAITRIESKGQWMLIKFTKLNN